MILTVPVQKGKSAYYQSLTHNWCGNGIFLCGNNISFVFINRTECNIYLGNVISNLSTLDWSGKSGPWLNWGMHIFVVIIWESPDTEGVPFLYWRLCVYFLVHLKFVKKLFLIRFLNTVIFVPHKISRKQQSPISSNHWS